MPDRSAAPPGPPRSPARRPQAPRRAAALVAALAGAGVFYGLGLPLPLLLGPIAGCMLAALAGVRMAGAGSLGTFMRTLLGVAIGATITPEVLARMPGMASSLAFVPVLVLAVAGPGFLFFRRGVGFDRATAFYAAMPGGLQTMLILGEEAGGDPRALSLVHATRILAIVATAPLVLSLAYGFDMTGASGPPASEVPVAEIVLMLAAGAAGWWGGARIGLFGASILGPLILTAVLSLAGAVQHRPPAEMIGAAQFFVGLAIGAEYTGVTLAELRRIVLAALGHAAILAAASLGIAAVVVAVTGHPGLDVILSFLPGGQAEMVIVALLTGADLAFVVTHHLLRVIIVITLAPLVFRGRGRG